MGGGLVLVTIYRIICSHQELTTAKGKARAEEMAPGKELPRKQEELSLFLSHIKLGRVPPM